MRPKFRSPGDQARAIEESVEFGAAFSSFMPGGKGGKGAEAAGGYENFLDTFFSKGFATGVPHFSAKAPKDARGLLSSADRTKYLQENRTQALKALRYGGDSLPAGAREQVRSMLLDPSSFEARTLAQQQGGGKP